MGNSYPDPTTREAASNTGALNDPAGQLDSKRRRPGNSSPQQGKDDVQAPTTDDEIDDGKLTTDSADEGEASGSRPS